MIKFTITKNSSISQARLGLLTTAHGTVTTPTFVPVATQATIKTLTSEETVQTGSQILIANTYHLHLKPGEDIVKRAGQLHKFMNWSKPLMTDSGGFQVFSLGFGQDHGVGKILKEKRAEVVQLGQQPNKLTITNDGVHFNSPVDGSSVYLDPKISMQIQQALGADIIFAFDEATSPVADEAYTKESLERTHRWAKGSINNKSSDQALFGIVQGGKFEHLRLHSAATIGAMEFDGFGIGGEYGDNKQAMIKILNLTMAALPPQKLRHVLGVGHLEDIPELIKSGADTFDCIVPTHYARHGTAFVNPVGTRLELTKKKFLTDQQPLDPTCHCYVCQSYQRSYIAHLVQAKEMTGPRLLTFHNLQFFNNYVAQLRDQLKAGQL